MPRKTNPEKPANKSVKKSISRPSSRGKVSRSSQEIRRRERLLAQLPNLQEVLRGSLVTRYRRCGRPNCHCAQKGARGHGPAYYLMVTVAPGKTVQVYVPEEQKRDVERWIKNYRRSREILEQISTLNRELLKQGKLFQGG